MRAGGDIATLSPESKALLAGLSRRRQKTALFKFRALSRFWSLCRRNDYRDRVAIAQRVVTEVKSANPKSCISVPSIYRWEDRFKRSGILGLADLKNTTDILQGVKASQLEEIRSQCYAIMQQSQGLVSHIDGLLISQKQQPGTIQKTCTQIVNKM